MKKTLFCISLLATIGLSAQTIFTGAKTTFTKTDISDFNIEVNQDRLTDNVWLTRANTGGIFNIKTETSFSGSSSPSDTEWAYGTTSNITSLTFGTMNEANIAQSTGLNNRPALNQDMVLHLITDDVYIDVKFLSWSQGRSTGGGFSYERSTNQILSNKEVSFKKADIALLDNNAILVKNVLKETLFSIYNTTGKKMKQGFVNDKIQISIKNLPTGVYLLRLNGFNTLKFVKQ